MRNKLSILLIFIAAFSLAASGQTKPLVFLRYIDNDEEISLLSDSVNLPLLIVGRAVYIIDADCISNSRSAGGDVSTRKERNAGGNVAVRNERNFGGDVAVRNERNTGGNVTTRNERNSGGDVSMRNERNSGGDVAVRNERNTGGDVATQNERSAGGDVGNGCGCEINTSGKFILQVPAIHKKEIMRVYYEHSFIDKKLYKIKII